MFQVDTGPLLDSNRPNQAQAPITAIRPKADEAKPGCEDLAKTYSQSSTLMDTPSSPASNFASNARLERPVAEERVRGRLAAILAADVVGSSD